MQWWKCRLVSYTEDENDAPRLNRLQSFLRSLSSAMSIRANSRFLLKIRAWLQTWIRCLALAYVEHINFHQTFFELWLFLAYVAGFFCTCSLKRRTHTDAERTKCVLSRPTHWKRRALRNTVWVNYTRKKSEVYIVQFGDSAESAPMKSL